MDIAKEFATDEKLELEGRLVPYDEKTSFRIARIGNSAYSRVLSRLYAQNKTVLNSKGSSAEVANERVMAEVFGKTILLGWVGPVSIDGKDLGEYTQAASMELCKFKEFRSWLAGHAGDFEKFKLHQEAEDAGN